MTIINRSFTYKDTIKISKDDFDLVICGIKKCTIRLGKCSVLDQRICLTFEENQAPVRITRVDNSRLYKDLTDNDAFLEGFNSLKVLQADLMKYYGKIESEQPMTVIQFELLE